jgi:hypothetical protein
MTGAGSSTAAWTAETSYLGGTGADPTYRLPGTNVQTETAEITRNLLDIVAPGDVETQRWIARNFEGQLSLSWILAADDFHRFLFNDSFTGFTSGLVNSAEWYLGVDYTGGTTERQIKGWAPATAQVAYSGSTEAVRVTVTGPYGDEVQNASITPGTISKPTDEVPGHGTTFSINSTTIGDRLQSATMQLQQISRLVRGASNKPIEAVAGNVQESISMASVYNGPERYKLALGGTTANSVEKDVDSVPATLGFDVGGNTIADYSFSKIAPENYDWVDLVNNEAELNEQIEWNATGLTASDPTA